MMKKLLFIHAAWSTAHCIKLLNNHLQKALCSHIIENSRSRSIEIIDFTSAEDHLHLLIGLHATQNLSQLIHDLKGESSNWINSGELLKSCFAWQEGYWAITVSPSHKKEVQKYYKNHELNHVKLSFREEVKLLRTAQFLY